MQVLQIATLLQQRGAYPFREINRSEQNRTERWVNKRSFNKRFNAKFTIVLFA